MSLEEVDLVIKRNMMVAADMAQKYKCFTGDAPNRTIHAVTIFLREERGDENDWIRHYKAVRDLCSIYSPPDCKVVKEYEVDELKTEHQKNR